MLKIVSTGMWTTVLPEPTWKFNGEVRQVCGMVSGVSANRGPSAQRWEKPGGEFWHHGHRRAGLGSIIPWRSTMVTPCRYSLDDFFTHHLDVLFGLAAGARRAGGRSHAPSPERGSVWRYRPVRPTRHALTYQRALCSSHLGPVRSVKSARHHKVQYRRWLRPILVLGKALFSCVQLAEWPVGMIADLWVEIRCRRTWWPEGAQGTTLPHTPVLLS